MSIFFAFYIICMVAMGIIWSIVVFRFGGFGGVADAMKMVSGLDVSSEYAQWMLVLLTILWWLPVGILIKQKFF